MEQFNRLYLGIVRSNAGVDRNGIKYGEILEMDESFKSLQERRRPKKGYRFYEKFVKFPLQTSDYVIFGKKVISMGVVKPIVIKKLDLAKEVSMTDCQNLIHTYLANPGDSFLEICEYLKLRSHTSNFIQFLMLGTADKKNKKRSGIN